MNVPPEVVEVVRKAEHDIEAASQAAEKYLKCLLTYPGIQAPRTQIRTLPDVRYADDWREPRLNDAKRAIAPAWRVRAAVRELLPPSVID
jgi:hypothetical protein